MAEEPIKQVLSLSGGGVRGLYTIKILAELEQQLAEEHGNEDYNISCHFDMICGTSIGGILALGLASGINARSLFKLLNDNRKKIFPTYATRFPFLAKLRKLVLPTYRVSPLKKILEDQWGKKIIGDLTVPVLIPAINYTDGKVQVFKTPHHQDFKKDQKLQLVDVALATSAAPTYFPIHKIGSRWYVDGGLIVNSPAYMAVHEFGHFLNIKPQNVRVMSVGTMGENPTANQKSQRLRWSGYLGGWGAGAKLIELSMGASESLHKKLAEHVLPENHYLQLDDSATMHQAKNIALDNATEGAAETLIGKAESKAQETLNDPIYKTIVNQQACTLTFYHGPNDQKIGHTE